MRSRARRARAPPDARRALLAALTAAADTLLPRSPRPGADGAGLAAEVAGSAASRDCGPMPRPRPSWRSQQTRSAATARRPSRPRRLLGHGDLAAASAAYGADRRRRPIARAVAARAARRPSLTPWPADAAGRATVRVAPWPGAS